MNTLAIPQLSHLTPIQLTAVPVKLNVAVDPMTLEAAIVPPLKIPVPEPNVVHEPVLVAALSSERVTARGGASGWRGVPPPPMLVGLLLSTTRSPAIKRCMSRDQDVLSPANCIKGKPQSL